MFGKESRVMPKRKLVIYESSLNGHRVRYVRHLVHEATKREYALTVVLPTDGRDSVEFKEELARFSDTSDYRFQILQDADLGWLNHYHRWVELKRVLIACGPCTVIVPTADHLAQMLWLFWFWWWHPAVRGSEIRCVMLRLRFGTPVAGVAELLKRSLTWICLAISPWKRFCSIDPRPVIAMQAWRFGPRLVYLPDPLDPHAPLDRAAARAKMGLSEDGIYAGCVGILDERKGIDLLVRAFASAAARTRGTLLLVGNASPGVARVIREHSFRSDLADRLVWVDRRPTEEELTNWMIAMNLVCLPYVGHDGIASFVLRAAACRRWILGCRNGWMGETISGRGLGWTCAVTDAAAFADALSAAISQAASGEDGYGDVNWLREHTAEHFCTALIDGAMDIR